MEDWFGEKCKYQIMIVITKNNKKIAKCRHGGNLCNDEVNCCDKCCPIDYGYLNNLKSGE